MKIPRFSVWTITDNKTKEAIEFFVSDAPGDSKLQTPVARFPISRQFPRSVQNDRAAMYRDYMNKIAEATEQAYEQTMLVDILKKP